MAYWIADWLRSDGPSWHYKRIWLDALVLTLSAALIILLMGAWLGMRMDDMLVENGPAEMLQSAFLALASILSALSLKGTRSLGRYVAAVTAAISFMFFIRELEVCHRVVTVFCVPRSLHIGSIVTASVALLIITVLFNYRHRGGFMRAIHPRLSWPLALIAAALFSSQVMEELDLLVIEEILELYGFSILLLSGCWLLRFSRGNLTRESSFRVAPSLRHLLHLPSRR